MLDATDPLKPHFVEAGISQLGEPLRCYEDEDSNGDGIKVGPTGIHVEVRASVSVLCVKPGPSAISIDRGGKPAAITRSSTKSAVGADMFPKRASIARSWSSAPVLNDKTTSIASTILAPPG